MEKLKNFKSKTLSQAEMYSVNGGKQTGPGSYWLDDVEMCYSSDRANRNGEIKKYRDLAPCDCEC